MTETLGEKIFRVESRRCRNPDGSNWKLDHGPYILDADLTHVECGNCKERLNPMSVLIAYAREENKIAYHFERIQLDIKKAKFKAERQNRVRCEHCQKLTRIRK